MVTIEIMAGMHIATAFKLALDTACIRNEEVEFEFNGTHYRATPSSTMDDLDAQYNRALCERRKKIPVYFVWPPRNAQEGWKAEAIGPNGETYTAIFYGRDAKTRAEMYASWMNQD